MAREAFDKLRLIWPHMSLNMKKKISIFTAFITARLLYALQAASLGNTERIRIDIFHARCLRLILKRPHAYYSHVSDTVMW